MLPVTNRTNRKSIRSEPSKKHLVSMLRTRSNRLLSTKSVKISTTIVRNMRLIRKPYLRVIATASVLPAIICSLLNFAIRRDKENLVAKTSTNRQRLKKKKARMEMERTNRFTSWGQMSFLTISCSRKEMKSRRQKSRKRKSPRRQKTPTVEMKQIRNLLHKVLRLHQRKRKWKLQFNLLRKRRRSQIQRSQRAVKRKDQALRLRNSK